MLLIVLENDLIPLTDLEVPFPYFLLIEAALNVYLSDLKIVFFILVVNKKSCKLCDFSTGKEIIIIY